MLATILSFARCPVCGYRNVSFLVGSIRPGMRRFTLQPNSIGYRSLRCTECERPLGWESYDQHALDAKTAGRLTAWREKQRAKQAAKQAAKRKARAAAV